MSGNLRGIIPVEAILRQLGAVQHLLVDVNERKFENHLFVLRFQDLNLYVLDGGKALADQGVQRGNLRYFKAGVFVITVLNYTCGYGDVGFEC